MYRIFWKKSAAKEIQEVPTEIRNKILHLINELCNIPQPKNCKKLVGLENFYRIRCGDYRIIYSLYKKLLTIEIIKIGHRKDIYK